MEKKGRQTELGKLNEEIMDNNRFLEETQKVLDQMAAKEKEQLKKTVILYNMDAVHLVKFLQQSPFYL